MLVVIYHYVLLLLTFLVALKYYQRLKKSEWKICKSIYLCERHGNGNYFSRKLVLPSMRENFMNFAYKGKLE